MLIGVPKEIKPDEYRVALTLAGTEALTSAGHQVLIEAEAGLGSGFTDDFYLHGGRTNFGFGGRHLGPGGYGHKGQGAHQSRVAENSERSGSLHLFPPRLIARIDGGPLGPWSSLTKP